MEWNLENADDELESVFHTNVPRTIFLVKIKYSKKEGFDKTNKGPVFCLAAS